MPAPYLIGLSCYRVTVRDAGTTWAPIIVAADRHEAKRKVSVAMPWVRGKVVDTDRLHSSAAHHGEAYAVRQVNGPERIAADIAAARAS